MTAEQIFSLLNLIAMAAWLVLILFPRSRWTTKVLSVVPALLAVVYVALLAVALPQGEGGFSSLAGVSALFENRWALLAGWTHYLAFDLFIGGWEVRDAQSRGIPHLLIVPALILTFLFGACWPVAIPHDPLVARRATASEKLARLRLKGANVAAAPPR